MVIKVPAVRDPEEDTVVKVPAVRDPEEDTVVKVPVVRDPEVITEEKNRTGPARIREANQGYIRYGLLFSKKRSSSFCQLILIRCWSHPASICSLNVDVPASFSK